tara:strand:- start:111 stop:542 length:432 start_codon:yes stop_codon:yes gene_type:complete
MGGIVEPLPLFLKDNNTLKVCFNSKTCNVAVKYCLYSRKKKRILKINESRANCKGNSKLSVHAEECAIKDLQKMDPKNKCDIYIWRYSKMGDIKPATCCKSCTKLLRKYNYDKRIFTFDNGEVKNAIVDDPVESIGNIIRKLR